MAAIAFGEVRLAAMSRLRQSSPGCDGWICYKGREPLPHLT